MRIRPSGAKWSVSNHFVRGQRKLTRWVPRGGKRRESNFFKFNFIKINFTPKSYQHHPFLVDKHQGESEMGSSCGAIKSIRGSLMELLFRWSVVAFASSLHISLYNQGIRFVKNDPAETQRTVAFEVEVRLTTTIMIRKENAFVSPIDAICAWLNHMHRSLSVLRWRTGCWPSERSTLRSSTQMVKFLTCCRPKILEAHQGAHHRSLITY